ncbi:hypothetical protein RHA1_ro08953 (plasmid) [Rhodococcus jostii RHA1]|uniref:Uncharacterized protein n=1 Tax=Rhodococcus jostii (strain RHA1) TaxID=101510 RepID=Q0RXI9_RHOJR|nr:hypothetical protein RHA1_ro08953 [Rhodococcus jostii RHA1]
MTEYEAIHRGAEVPPKHPQSGLAGWRWCDVANYLPSMHVLEERSPKSCRAGECRSAFADFRSRCGLWDHIGACIVERRPIVSGWFGWQHLM